VKMVEPTSIASLQVQLPVFERQDVQGKEVVFYRLHVCSGRKKWKLQKRFNEFYDLDRDMKVKHSNLPKLPPKTYFPLKLDKDIDDRRQQLHMYL